MESPTQEWFVADRDLTIVVTEMVLESMRRAAMVGLQKIPRRGLEIGGVLFGRREGNRIEIHQWREIECEHARGPGFDLSEKDEKGLAELLEAAKEDPALSELEAVGLFRTRTRGDLMVSEEDVALFDRFFPERWQMLFVVRPHMYEPARAGFFLRDREGRMATGAPAAEMRLEVRRRRLPLDFDPSERPRRAAKEAPQVPAASSGGGPGTFAGRPSPAIGIPAPEPLPYPGSQPGGWRLSAWPVAAVVGAVALAALAVIFIAPLLSDETATGIAFGVRQVGDQLIVEWNPQASAVQAATSASLEIADGDERRTIELSREELRGGSLTYQSAGGEVTFRLRVRTSQGETVTEAAKYLGAPAARPAGAEAGRRSETADLEIEIKRLKSELEQQRLQSEALQQAIEAKRRQLGSANP